MRFYEWMNDILLNCSLFSSYNCLTFKQLVQNYTKTVTRLGYAYGIEYTVWKYVSFQQKKTKRTNERTTIIQEKQTVDRSWYAERIEICAVDNQMENAIAGS